MAATCSRSIRDESILIFDFFKIYVICSLFSNSRVFLLSVWTIIKLLLLTGNLIAHLTGYSINGNNQVNYQLVNQVKDK